MRFSVVIPSYQRKETLRLVLAAWENQQPADLDFELVVVDDGSQDGTADFLAAWRPRRYNFRFARQENSGPAQARNHALQMADGDLVLFTGDDIEPTPHLLEEHLKGHLQHDDPRVAILGLTRWPDKPPFTETSNGSSTDPNTAAQGAMITAPMITASMTTAPMITAPMITATMRHIDGPGAQQFSYRFFEDGGEYDFRHLYTSNISLRRTLLDLEPTGFCTDFPAAAFEDAEFGYRLATHGLRIIYHQKAVAWHHHPYDARAFYRRQQRCGNMAFVLYKKLPELRRYLDLETLENARLDLLQQALGGDSSGDNLPSTIPLSEAEERALRIATFFDPLPFDEVDLLLQPLFRHGYLSGLAQALYPQATAKRLMTLLFARHLMPALAQFEEKIIANGMPRSEADFAALGDLVPHLGVQ
jgi:glycosyltransferase involved in cell wall biosynthesis